MNIFISHAPSNELLARHVANALRKAGFQTWDQTQILPGDNWAAETGRALERANAMLVLLTPAALQATNVQGDVSYALGQLSYKNRVVPVLAADPGEVPLDEIPWILRKFQMMELPHLAQDPAEMERLISRLNQLQELALSQ
jgi:hypothetical protein